MNNDTGVGIVIPNWNGRDYILDCIASLRKQTLHHDIIVVDNGSEDDSVQLIRDKFPDTIILENEENLGFAGGVNVGLSFAAEHKFQYIALFNNDATADKAWLSHLIDSAKRHPKAGIITGKFLRHDKKTFDSTGEQYTIWGVPFARGRDMKDAGQFDNEEEVLAATGGASLYRIAAIKDVGYFDESYFAYYEDVDISLRMQLRGWKIVYNPSAVAFHLVSQTTSKLGDFTRFHSSKNFHLLYIKNMPGTLLMKYWLLFSLKSLLLFISSTVRLKPHVFIKGYLSFIRLLPSALSLRREIQKNRKVEVKYIDSMLSREFK